jgi:hypothetical protein
MVVLNHTLMKKALLLAVLVSVYLFSCKKDNKSPSGTKYKVKFNVSGFSQQIVDVASKNKQLTGFNADQAAPTTYAIDVLHYYAYDSSNKLVTSINQDSTFSSFGTIDDSLLPGTYSIVIAGSKAGVVYNPGTNYLAGNIGGYVPWHDTFFQEFSLTVGTQPINQNVTLKRIVGKLSVLITDKLPATASTLSITVNEAYSYYFSVQAPSSLYQYTFTNTIPASAIGTANYKQSIIMMNTLSPFTAVIACADATGKVLAQSTIANVSLQQNTETILSGALFGSNVGFGLTLNQVWNAAPITIKY